MMESHIKKHGQHAGSQRFFAESLEILRSGQINYNRISIRSLFENFTSVDGEFDLTRGRQLVDAMNPRFQTGGVLIEAGGAVNTGAFSNIIGQITYSTVLTSFEQPEFFAMDLFEIVPATTQQPEIVPGVSMIGDVAEDVGEDMEYPRVGLSEEFITIPRKIKDGYILPITEEAVFEDKTGLIMRNANMANQSMAITLEKELLDTALGVDTSYSRNGGAQQATYGDTHNQGDFDNLAASNALVDYRNVESATLLFDDMTDPNTAEPVMIGGELDIIVPTALELTVGNVLNSVSLKLGADSGSVQMLTGNNVLSVQSRRSFTPRSSQWVKNRTSSASTWFIGAFKRAFQYHEIWPIQVFRMDRNSEAGFSRDIITQIKVRRKGVPAVVSPWHVIKCTAEGIDMAKEKSDPPTTTTTSPPDQMDDLHAEILSLKSENETLRTAAKAERDPRPRQTTDSEGVVHIKGKGDDPRSDETTRKKYNKTFKVVNKSSDPKPTAIVSGVCDESEAVRIVRLVNGMKSKDSRFVCEAV